VARIGDRGDGYEVLLENMRDKGRLLGRTRRRWYNCIKMDLKEIGWEGVSCTGLPQDRGKKKLAPVNAEVIFPAP
jgi:hypothetical protein